MKLIFYFLNIENNQNEFTKKNYIFRIAHQEQIIIKNNLFNK